MEFYAMKKENKDKKAYFVLFADLGYKERIITFDENVIAELLGLSLRDLYSLELEKRIEVK